MYDPEFGHIDNRNEIPAANPRRRRWILIPLAFVCALAVLSSFNSPRPYTCAACRLDRTDHGFLWFRWSDFAESECSRWYAANVEPSHQHVWADKPHCRWSGITGINGHYSCNVGSRVANFAKSLQLRAYKRFRDPVDAKGLFVRLGQTDSEGARLMEGLAEWTISDSPEPWAEWWPKNRRS